MTKPLVLDLTRLLPGPLAGRMLAELGFRVHRLLPPAGDLTATSCPDAYRWLNLGKEEETIDLKTELGKNRLLELVPAAQVLLDTNRPGVMERLGVGPEVLRAVNPTLTYVRIAGFSDPEFRELPGHDMTYLAADGLLDRFSPASTQVQLADTTGAFWGVIAALEGIRSGGGFFEVYMQQTARAMAYPTLPLLDGSAVCYAVYSVSDGRVALGALEPHLWSRFCNAIGHEDWSAHGFSATTSNNPVWVQLKEVFLQKTAGEWDEWARANMMPLRAVRKDRLPDTLLPWRRT